MPGNPGRTVLSGRGSALVLSLVLIATGCADADRSSGSTTTEAPGEPEAEQALVLYGIDFSAVSDLPEAEPYDDFELIEDDTAQVEVSVPTDWEDVDTRMAERDGEDVPGIWASTDLDALDEGYSVPGVQVDLRTADSVQEVLDLLGSDNATDDACAASETFDYDDGLFTGTAELWTDCGEESAALLQVAAYRGEDQYVSVEVQMLTQADVEAAARALADFNAVDVGTGEGSTGSDADGDTVPTTEDEADALPEDAGFQMVLDNGNVVDVEPEMPIFSLRGGDFGRPGASDFMIAAPEGPEDQWRLAEEPDILHALASYDGTSLDGEMRYFKFLSMTYGFTTLTFENCPGCPESGGQPTETVEIGLTVEDRG